MREVWERLAKENGLPGFYFYGLCRGVKRLKKTEECGYDAIVYDHMPTVYETRNMTFTKRVIRKLLHKPYTIQYSDYLEETMRYFNEHPSLVPCLIPNFDHSPRSSFYGLIMEGSNPERWYEFCRRVKELLKKTPRQDNIVFIKAWYEWGEGNYMEPDLKYGKGYLEATLRAFSEK